MARARPGLEKAVQEALVRHGEGGKRLSLRQAERLTGLSPATVGELAKGNARTQETVRRFAEGLGEDVNRFLLLAGFVPEDAAEALPLASSPSRPFPSSVRTKSERASRIDADTPEAELEPDEREWLERFGRALAKMPSGRDRDLFKESLRHNTELIERFLECLADADR